MYAKSEGSGETEAGLSFYWSPICKVPKLCARPFIVLEVVGKTKNRSRYANFLCVKM